MSVKKVTVVPELFRAEVIFNLPVMLDAIVASAEIRRAMMPKFDINVGGYVIRLVLRAKQLDMYLKDKCYTCSFKHNANNRYIYIYIFYLQKSGVVTCLTAFINIDAKCRVAVGMKFVKHLK